MFAAAAPSSLSRALQLISGVMRAFLENQSYGRARAQGPGLPGHRGRWPRAAPRGQCARCERIGEAVLVVRRHGPCTGGGSSLLGLARQPYIVG